MLTEESHIPHPRDVPVPAELPILPSGDAVIYPGIIVPLASADPGTIRIIDEAMAKDKIAGVFAERRAAAAEEQEGEEARRPAAPEDLYTVGTAAVIARMVRMPDGSVRALLQGLRRIRLGPVTQREPFIRARVEVIPEPKERTPEIEALSRSVLGQFQKIVELAPNLPQELALAALNISDPAALADFVAPHINLSLPERQEVLETIAVAERLRKVAGFMRRELEILEVGSKIQSQIKEQASKVEREYYLRQQLKAIQKELGESDQQTTELNELRARLEQAQLPEEARKQAQRELDRLAAMNPAAADYSMTRTYIDWLLGLPWSASTQDSLDIPQAGAILDEDHYGLGKVKDRILEFLAVAKLKGEMKGPILCFVGPPGVGKTSMGQSIARALGRKFVRLSLGGVRDEAEIRGHRRTYIGALPGRIIQGLRRAESNNPVFMLDEIDKLGADFRGDPAAALLEVLDPEQNHSFSDHYLEVAFDLSHVLFITTANIVDTIPPALRDRMETLELPGYTQEEKLQIATRYLVPRQLAANGLKADQLIFTPEALAEIIERYTREAGVRNLERELGAICRKVGRHLAQGDTAPVTVWPQQVREFLGRERLRPEVAEEKDEVGVATGLAWTPAGGEILHIEVALVPGKGNLILTGQLGDVMKESATAAFTYARSRARSLGVAEDFYAKLDVHVHIPAGAIPKDGPSAGVAMAVALVSALTRRPVAKDVGMTGEITLRGKVLPVGGIKEKMLAAHRAGLKCILLPAENEPSLEDVPAQVRKELRFVFIAHADEAVREALRPEAVAAEVAGVALGGAPPRL
ncbi:MAG: endopeptidase La, partial [Chloroflexi bacterium]|nr:endopeptidase La [Chloroflexota bacterium]